VEAYLQYVAQIRREDHEDPLSDVDDLHDTEDECLTGGHQRVHTSGEYPEDDALDDGDGAAAEERVDERERFLITVVAEGIALGDVRRTRVEHLVLVVATTELGADQVPGQAEQLDALFGRHTGGAYVAQHVRACLRIRQLVDRRRHLQHATAGQLP